MPNLRICIENPSFLNVSFWRATVLNLCSALSTRKSYEFEDLLQVDWYAQSRLGLTRTLSEENVYEDIIGKQCITFLDSQIVVLTTNWECIHTCVLSMQTNNKFHLLEQHVQGFSNSGDAGASVCLCLLFSLLWVHLGCWAFINAHTKKPDLHSYLIVHSVMLTSPASSCPVGLTAVVVRGHENNSDPWLHPWDRRIMSCAHNYFNIWGYFGAFLLYKSITAPTLFC